MSNFMTFTCPLPPSVNEYLGKRVAYNPITKKPFVQVYETAKAKAFKKHMNILLKRVMDGFKWEKTGEFTYVICEIHMYSNQKRKDADNMFKCLLDCLTEAGVVYDDSMVLPRVTELVIDKDNPRLEVFIRESGKVGIFKTYGRFEAFVDSNCCKCTRYSRNCSILKEAKENKVKAEITVDEDYNYYCSSFKLKKGL